MKAYKKVQMTSFRQRAILRWVVESTAYRSIIDKVAKIIIAALPLSEKDSKVDSKGNINTDFFCVWMDFKNSVSFEKLINMPIGLQFLSIFDVKKVRIS